MGEPAAPGLPEGDARSQVARWLGLTLPSVCEAGVDVNLALLADHAATVRSALAELVGSE